MPWLVAGIVDKRRAADDRRTLANAIYRLPRENLDEWFGKTLMSKVDIEAPGDYLMKADFQIAILNRAWSVHLSVAHIEVQHGRNRARPNENQHWQTFQALVAWRSSCMVG